METTKQAVGRRVRELRLRAGFRSADKLAERMKISATSVYELERGDNWISPEMLEKLVEVLRVDPSVFFSDEIKAPPPNLPEIIDAIRDLAADAAAARALRDMNLLPQVGSPEWKVMARESAKAQSYKPPRERILTESEPKKNGSESTNSYQKQLPGLFKKKRLEAGLSFKQVAAQLEGVTKEDVEQWEQPDSKGPPGFQVYALTKLYKIPAEEFNKVVTDDARAFKAARKDSDRKAGKRT